MRLNIVVRTDAPWETMTHDAFLNQVGSVNLPRSGQDIPALIRTWESAYGMSYFEYRATLKRACAAEHRYVDAHVSYVEPFALADVVVCVDDDDVIFPEVVNVLPLFEDPAVNVVTWNRQTVIHGAPHIENARRFIDTCNAAVRKSYIDTWPIEDRRMMYAKHQRMHKNIGRRLGVIPPKVNGHAMGRFTTSKSINHPSVVDIRENYSAYYLHCGSISFLAHKMRAPEDVVSYLRTLPLHPLYSVNQAVAS